MRLRAIPLGRWFELQGGGDSLGNLSDDLAQVEQRSHHFAELTDGGAIVETLAVEGAIDDRLNPAPERCEPRGEEQQEHAAEDGAVVAGYRQ